MEKSLVDLRNMTRQELRDFLVSLGQPAFRGDQIFSWIAKGITDPAKMGNLPGTLRKTLQERGRIQNLSLVRSQRSQKDGTIKSLFSLPEDLYIESVRMEYHYGTSVCISSQAGCRMGCVFCASGRNGLSRNLTAGEMVGQVIQMQEEDGRIGHVVVMGTGEPFENYEELSRFIEIINDEQGLKIGMRNITVSTCGLVPEIRRFAGDFPQVNLAVSLHAATQERREQIMPIARKYPLTELMEACRFHVEKTHRRITFEYALIRGINDGDEDAEGLIRLLRGLNCHVNLIPLNDVADEQFSGSERKRAMAICDRLNAAGVQATLRRTLGEDIDAACGQLRLREACPDSDIRV